MAQFAIENLTFSYPTDPEHPSLQEVSLQVEQGEYIALCGKSGSGKTTLLRHLKTVLTPHGNRTGSIFYEGAPLDQADLRKQSSEIGFVMQNPDSQIVTDKVWHELAWRAWAATRKPCACGWQKWPAISAFKAGFTGMWQSYPAGRSSF